MERSKVENSPAINEFPEDVFTNKERQQGGVLLHIIAALYMFYALAIVCDDFFVPSLEKICEKLHLSEDVAGATFMAAGSSTPELFASVIGVFITHGDVGVGTIVGSAVFNILCIVGVCGLFAGQVVCLTQWAVFRDSVYYTLSVIVLIVFIYDEKIEWYNVRMQNFFTLKSKNVGNGDTVNNELEDGNKYYASSYDDPSIPLLCKVKGMQQYGKNSVVMVDEIICSSPPKYRFPEAGLRIMITNKFGPRTRMRMASRLIINERQRLIQSANGSGKPLQNGRHENIENGNIPVVNQEEESEQDNLSPFSLPDGKMNKVKWILTWPLIFLLFCTIPNCSKPRWESWFMFTFVLSTLWIALFSYFMVWMENIVKKQPACFVLRLCIHVTVIGYTLGIPDVIMGITFLAAGTSVPDCMASLIVARQGLGDMAVSNTIGSNVFDILVGLGVPWGLQTMAIDCGSTVKINSKGLVYSVALLLGSVALTVSIRVSKCYSSEYSDCKIIINYLLYIIWKENFKVLIIPKVSIFMCHSYNSTMSRRASIVLCED
uniref:Solute carrier family 24 member 4 n=1 Tax=Anas platyrhynchos platyrhynchos TaxID=8840 RepID=A0A493T9L2_ANAPP